jgi:hypothetical protein
LKVDWRTIYVDIDQLSHAEANSNNSGYMLARALLACVFDSRQLKYCSVAGKAGPHSIATGYKCRDGSSIMYAPLHQEGLQAILGILKTHFI